MNHEVASVGNSGERKEENGTGLGGRISRRREATASRSRGVWIKVRGERGRMIFLGTKSLNQTTSEKKKNRRRLPVGGNEKALCMHRMTIGCKGGSPRK